MDPLLHIQGPHVGNSARSPCLRCWLNVVLLAT